MSPAMVDLLIRRYGLSPEAQPLVQRLLDAWQEGHTALQLEPAEATVMARSAAVSEGGLPKPLVLLPSGLLQSWRLHRAEQRILAAMLSLAQAAPEPLAPAVAKALAQVWKDPAEPQRQAAELGLTRRLALITGGPGTGKTYTAARLLALLGLQQPALRFALAAPTGKAAQRLGESLSAAASGLPSALAAQAPLLQAAGRQAGTLHRLLAWRPGADSCGYHAQRPLPFDLVLVDESSMLDVMLWDALLQALPKGARLVVLGDQHQLESVEPGRVLGSLVEAAEAAGPLKGCHVELRTNHRFAEHPGIGRAALAILDHDMDALLAAATLAPTASQDVERFAPQALDQALDKVWPAVMGVAAAQGPEPALRALGALRVLCALNQGPWGVSGLNARIQARLQREGLASHASPVLVTVNDPASGLFNGDLGVLLPGAQGGLAYFGDPLSPKRLPEASLPQHQTAWAMTVHRSQGSEYACILLVLPDAAHELVGPELLYTAVTRAKERVILVAEIDVLQAGVKEREKRVTSF